MKRKWFSAAALLLFFFTSCELNTSNNGPLDGYWQMTRVDTLDNGHSADVRSRLIFWAVQADMLEMRSQFDLEQVPVIFRFELNADRLRVYSPVADNREISDSIVTHPSTVAYYGVGDLDETLLVKTLNSKKMVLETEHHLLLYFRKY